jgi:uncharacterized protein YodC (DUF2158 family)
MYSPTGPRIVAVTLLLTICASGPAVSAPLPVPMALPSTVAAVPPRFERGDLVRLKSGGPMMTVSAVRGDEIECIWTDDNGQPDDATFSTYVLQKF